AEQGRRRQRAEGALRPPGLRAAPHDARSVRRLPAAAARALGRAGADRRHPARIATGTAMNVRTPTLATKPAERMAAFAAGLTCEDIPEAVRERARIQILDGLGVGFASNAFPFAEKTLAGIAAMAGPGDCTVLGRTLR